MFALLLDTVVSTVVQEINGHTYSHASTELGKTRYISFERIAIFTLWTGVELLVSVTSEEAAFVQKSKMVPSSVYRVVTYEAPFPGSTAFVILNFESF